jgi:ATP-dependent DNA helicase RecG
MNNLTYHRDLCPLSMIRAISLIIEDNRLVLSNPGGLLGISTDELGKTPSVTRNTRLAEICQYVPAESGSNVIEKLGSGILKMYAEQERAGFAKPGFVDGGIYFTAILRKGVPALKQGPYMRPRASNTDLILSVLPAGALSRMEIEERTGLSPSQVRYALTKLMREKRVARIGGDRGPNSAYALIDGDENVADTR